MVILILSLLFFSTLCLVSTTHEKRQEVTCGTSKCITDYSCYSCVDGSQGCFLPDQGQCCGCANDDCWFCKSASDCIANSPQTCAASSFSGFLASIGLSVGSGIFLVIILPSFVCICGIVGFCYCFNWFGVKRRAKEIVEEISHATTKGDGGFEPLKEMTDSDEETSESVAHFMEDEVIVQPNEEL